jgi:hypothetical protein
VAEADDIQILIAKLRETKDTIKRLEGDLQTATAASSDLPAAPTAAEIETKLPMLLDLLMERSYEFGDFLRKLMPVFLVTPIQAVDSGKAVAKAEVTFSFAGLLERRPPKEYSPRDGDFTVRLDLFESPPHIRHLEACTKLHAEHPDWTAETIGNAIGIERWTVRSALKLYAKMQAENLAEPYLPITDPSKVSRWRMQNSHRARWDQTSMVTTS